MSLRVQLDILKEVLKLNLLILTSWLKTKRWEFFDYLLSDIGDIKMTYYSDLATSSNELYAYEVSIEHFKELLDLSYEMLDDLYTKMHSRHDFAISLQSYSIALSHLSKSVNKYHPQIPYLEVPSLESMSVEESLSLEGFVDFIKAIWEKIIEFFRALWNFISRLFSSSSTKRSREVNKEIKNTLDKASHEKEEVRDEIIEKVNEHFKVITPRLIRSKKFVDENTIDYVTYLEIIEELIGIMDKFFKVFEAYQIFNTELMDRCDKVAPEIHEFVRNPDLSIIRQNKSYVHPIGILKDKLRNYSYEVFEKYRKENKLDEIKLDNAPKEIKDYYNKNVRIIAGLESNSFKLFKVLDLDHENSYLTLYLLHYNVETSPIYHHKFITRSMIDKEGKIRDRLNNDNLTPCKVKVNTDYKTFEKVTKEILTKVENKVIDFTPKVAGIQEFTNKQLSDDKKVSIFDAAERIYGDYYNYMFDVIMDSDDEELEKEYNKVYRPNGVPLSPDQMEKNRERVKQEFIKTLTDAFTRIWQNLGSLATVLSVNYINVLEIFNKEKEYLEKIMEFALEEAKKKDNVSKNNS